MYSDSVERIAVSVIYKVGSLACTCGLHSISFLNGACLDAKANCSAPPTKNPWSPPALRHRNVQNKLF